MANQRDPNEPYRPNRTDDEIRNAAAPDRELPPFAEPAEGPASGGRLALFAVAVAVVLGAVFYGLNNSSVNKTGGDTAQTTSNQSTAQTSPPAVPPGVRDVTPRNNMAPGVTTGAAPAQPPAVIPYNANQNRSGNPATDNAPASK
jgi:hypothetical protein